MPPNATGPVQLTQRLPRALPRTRILLVDDIVANQTITATLLRREGHMVDVVGSGAAAIEALRARPYDLVFMDIFMPGMGGQEATSIIRSLPEPAGSTPVIALTANVSAEDDTLFRAAGMDGLIGKPVSLTELLEAIRHYVWSAGRSGHPAEAAPRQAERILDDAILVSERIAELRNTLAPETFASLVDECLTDMEHRLPALRRALAAGSPGAITAHAHAMVGMAAGYGMAALETRLRAIMAAVREGDHASLGPEMIGQVEADWIAASRALRESVQNEVA